MAKLIVTVDIKNDSILEDRLGRIRNLGPTLVPADTAVVQFLRGVDSRSWIALSNFYLTLGATAHRNEESSSDFPMWVLAHAVEFSLKSTTSLCCRKVFDDAKTEMTGKKFAISSVTVLNEVATYWANRSGREQYEARKALSLLQAVFEACSKTKKELLNSPMTLARRVGLLKRHADAQAAHLSFDYFEFDVYDSAHVVAALALIGTIIHGFDDPGDKDDYFDTLDEAAWTAAKRVFPSMKGRRLFQDIGMTQLAAIYCGMEINDGVDKLMNHLPFVIGWWR